jgi:hypothetical protein
MRTLINGRGEDRFRIFSGCEKVDRDDVSKVVCYLTVLARMIYGKSFGAANQIVAAVDPLTLDRSTFPGDFNAAISTA